MMIRQMVSRGLVYSQRVSRLTYTAPDNSKTYFGALRVDEAVTHNITYTVSSVTGNRFSNQAAIVTLQNFDKETTILEELRRGRYIRFKLDDNIFLRFSLAGFTSASAPLVYRKYI
jgi:hypothetical protein